MAKPRNDQEMEETRRIMERLVNTPHKPHKPLNDLLPNKRKPEKKKPRQRAGAK
jgi:hypothetical protein